MGLFSFLAGYKNFGKVNLEICETYKEVSNNVLFRLENDSDNVIRIKQEYPLNKPRKWDISFEEWNTPVAGVSYRVQNVMNLMAGSSRQIILAQEPMPKYPHAIAVYGRWNNKRGKGQRKQLGYLQDYEARQITKRLAKMKDYLLLAKLAKMFIPTRDKEAPGLRIDVAILEPALPRFEVPGIGRDSGRKRKRTYRAINKEKAIEKANNDGIIVDVKNIKRL